MADAIWNNNYLLSNLDAQKLYAQSPLTTGVSGTSAYIGIEPSARYDETVLYENATGSSAIDLSEAYTNFDRVKILFRYWEAGYGTRKFSEFPTDENYFTFCESWVPMPLGNGNAVFIGGFSATSNTHFELTRGCYNNLNGASQNTWVQNSTNCKIQKVIGINRKEV